MAHGGTIFLDEIGEISQATQVNLLRVLDTSVFRHVGGTSEIRVDVRVLAATNRDLRAMVAKGLFREDLLLPHEHHQPWRFRRCASARAMSSCWRAISWTCSTSATAPARCWAKAAMEALRRHAWPGNVRELLHAVEAAVVVCEGDGDPARAPAAAGARRTRRRPPPVPRTAMAAACPRWWNWSWMHIRRALEASHGHRGNAARMLGISERNLYRKLKEHRLLG